jgi:hypothetical protein
MKYSILAVACATALTVAAAVQAAAPAPPGPGAAPGAAPPGAAPGGAPGAAPRAGGPPRAGGAGPAAGGAPGQARRNYPVEPANTKCPRATMKAVVDGYSAALAAHDPSKVKIAPNVMFTENGVQMAPGTSTLWKGAGT